MKNTASVALATFFACGLLALSKLAGTITHDRQEVSVPPAAETSYEMVPGKTYTFRCGNMVNTFTLCETVYLVEFGPDEVEDCCATRTTPRE